jgi:hypothetical protein
MATRNSYSRKQEAPRGLPVPARLPLVSNELSNSIETGRCGGSPHSLYITFPVVRLAGRQSKVAPPYRGRMRPLTKREIETRYGPPRPKSRTTWRLLYILHDGSQATYEDYNYPYEEFSCTRIWATSDGIEFTADYDWGPLHPYQPHPGTTEIYPVRPFEDDCQQWEGECPPFVTLRYMRSAPFTVWWRRT